MYKPERDEYAPYYGKYISLVAESDIREAFRKQPDELRDMFSKVAEDKGTYAYAAGKWTIKEVLSHLIDGERIFAYRMLRVARGDKTPIEGFEQDDYIATSNANNRAVADLLDEFELCRKSNVIMLNNFDEAALKRVGTASNCAVTTRALANIAIGHVRHHLSILNERYLV